MFKSLDLWVLRQKLGRCFGALIHLLSWNEGFIPQFRQVLTWFLVLRMKRYCLQPIRDITDSFSDCSYLIDYLVLCISMLSPNTMYHACQSCKRASGYSTRLGGLNIDNRPGKPKIWLIVMGAKTQLCRCPTLHRLKRFHEIILYGRSRYFNWEVVRKDQTKRKLLWEINFVHQLAIIISETFIQWKRVGRLCPVRDPMVYST